MIEFGQGACCQGDLRAVFFNPMNNCPQVLADLIDNSRAERVRYVVYDHRKSANSSNDFVLLYQFSNLSAIIKAGGTETTINTSVSPSLGQWTHLALVYNGTDMRVYVNGVLSDVQFGTGANSINYGNFGQSNSVDVIAVDEAGNASAPATLTFQL